jgi:hypothetical protein
MDCGATNCHLALARSYYMNYYNHFGYIVNCPCCQTAHRIASCTHRVASHPCRIARIASTISLRLQLFQCGFNYFTAASTNSLKLQLFHYFTTAPTISLRLQLFHYGFNHFTTASTISLRLQLFHYGSNYFTTASSVSLRLQLFHYGFDYSPPPWFVHSLLDLQAMTFLEIALRINHKLRFESGLETGSPQMGLECRLESATNYS